MNVCDDTVFQKKSYIERSKTKTFELFSSIINKFFWAIFLAAFFSILLPTITKIVMTGKKVKFTNKSLLIDWFNKFARGVGHIWCLLKESWFLWALKCKNFDVQMILIQADGGDHLKETIMSIRYNSKELHVIHCLNRSFSSLKLSIPVVLHPFNKYVDFESLRGNAKSFFNFITDFAFVLNKKCWY